MATVKTILVLVCFTFIGWGNVFNGHLLGTTHLKPSEHLDRQRIIAIARTEIGIKELTGNNDGKRVEEYLNSVGLGKGDPYCAAFVSFVFKKAGYPRPRTGWSPALFPKNRLVKQPLTADVFGIYFPSLKRVAHCGFVDRRNGDWLVTTEANTDPSGGRNGDGVYTRLRHIKTIHNFADWTRKGGLK